MGISSPTINFPVDETIKRIEYVKANAMGIIHEAKKSNEKFHQFVPKPMLMKKNVSMPPMEN